MGSVAEILEKKKVRYIRIDGATSRFDWIKVYPWILKTMNFQTQTLSYLLVLQFYFGHEMEFSNPGRMTVEILISRLDN